MNRMSPAGLDGKDKGDGRMDPFGRMNRMAGSKKRRFQDLRFHSTFDIIAAVEKGSLPDKIMINTHPQRWTDNPVEWTKELMLQRMKNGVKYVLVKVRKKKGMIRYARDDTFGIGMDRMIPAGLDGCLRGVNSPS